MKNKLLSILICGLLFTILLTGCDIIKNELEIGNESNIEQTTENVILTLKDGTLTKNGATFILKNNDNVVYSYGPAWELEIKQGGTWHKINVVLNFNSPLYQLDVNEAKELNINWEDSYGTLPEGDYRIIKAVDIENADEVFEKFYVTSEFTIK